ncbi:MAG: 2-oxoglutarate dehydrogenase complex dihydrolipoyllysine-residue succinyltransferase [Deltaproteobacteria bacterium]|nr:MAG: 2-oxoglutarate dehydrogenase complex dihydrolipoyllysine-residue succinyltransferase [Deltaproteobacteria bacterium]
MPVDVNIPQIGESITTVFIARWIAKPGAFVAAGEPILEVDSDKASMEIPAPVAGKLLETLAEEGDEVEIGAVVARLDDTASEGASDAAPAESAEAPAESGGAVKAGPAARQAAREGGVDLGSVEGTGKGGRVTRADVERTGMKPPPKAPAARPASAAAAPALPAGATERVPMSPLRRTIARRLVEAQQNAAMLTTFQEVDMSAVMNLRKSYQDQFVKRYGFKLGFMSFFVKATIEGLKRFPAVNAEIDGTDIIYKNFYNIGVAVSGPKGLVVPVVRDADQLSFAETENAIAELAGKARDNKLSIADFQDGTFTISNGGIFGSMLSTPILNPPQVGILGMHNIVQRPWVVDGKIEIRPIMYLALSYDHRIIDGREAVGFLKTIRECVEAPERILLEV